MIAPVKARDLRRNLLSKGFVEVEARDHYLFILHVREKKTSFLVKLSRSADAIRRDEIKVNAKGLRVTGNDLHRIMSCEADHAETLRIHGTRELAR